MLIGLHIRDGLAPEYRDEFDDYLREIQEKGVARGIMRVRTAGGETRVWEYYNTLRTEGVQRPIVRGMVRPPSVVRLVGLLLLSATDQERAHQDGDGGELPNNSEQVMVRKVYRNQSEATGKTGDGNVQSHS